MTSQALKIRVGLFVAVTASLLALVLVVFGGLRFWENHASYRIVFGGSVMGLEKGATVYFNGIKVGHVEEIELSPRDLSTVEVEISVQRETPIHTDTKALLEMAGITGLKVVDLRDGSRTAPRLAEGGLITQGETTLDKFERQAKDIADTSTQLMKRASLIVENLVALTDPAKYQAIDEILAHMKRTSQSLALASTSLDMMINEDSTALKATLAQVQGTARSVSAMLDGPTSALLGNAGALVAGLKNLITSNEGQLRSAMFDLRQASRSFKELARDLRQRPSRLLFSNDPGERKLP